MLPDHLAFALASTKIKTLSEKERKKHSYTNIDHWSKNSFFTSWEIYKLQDYERLQKFYNSNPSIGL